MPDFGIQPDATFRARRYTDVVTYLQGKVRDELGAGAQVEPPFVLGFLIRAFAWPVAELWSVAAYVYDQVDPERVQGTRQDVLYSWWGLRRQLAAGSRVQLKFTGPPETVIPEGTPVRDPVSLVRVQTAEALTLPAGSGDQEGEVEAVAVEPGPTVIPPGTMTQIEALSVQGLTVTNEAAAITGRLRETNEEFRARWRIGRSVLGRFTLSSLVSQLYELVPGLLSATVYVNRLSYPDDEGRPPHSCEVVLWPPTVDQAQAARVIAYNLPDGASTAGEESAIVTQEDAAGRPWSLEVRWTLAVGVPVEVRIGSLVVAPCATPELVQQAIVSRVVAHIEGAQVGDAPVPGIELGLPVRFFGVVGTVACTPGVLSATVEIRRAGDAWGTVDLSFGPKEKATCAPEDVTFP